MRALTIACLCLAIAGCSKSTTANVQTDLKQAGDNLKQAGQDAGQGLQASADQAKVDADLAAAKAKKAADDLKYHAQQGAADVKHDLKGDNS